MKRYIAQNMVIFAGAGIKVSVFYHLAELFGRVHIPVPARGSRNLLSVVCMWIVLAVLIAPEFHANFIVPDWGDKVDSGGIGLSYRPARLYIGWQAGTTPLYAEVNYIQHSATMNLATDYHSSISTQHCQIKLNPYLDVVLVIDFCHNKAKDGSVICNIY
jgi:hypothetical protein